MISHVASNRRLHGCWGLAILLLGVVGGCAKPARQTSDEAPHALRAWRARPAPGWSFRSPGERGGGLPPRARALALDTARANGLVEAPGSWVGVGPRNVGGRATALGVDPNDPDRIWVGTAAGGIFLTEDAGLTFRPVFDDQVALSIGSIAVHPTDSNTVYVGTGEDNGAGYSYDGDGVYKTTDGGQSWVNLGLAEVRRIGRLAVDPTDGNRVYVAAGGDWYAPDANRGIYRSSDGGQSWQQVLFVGNDAGGIDIAIDPANPARLFAAIWQRASEGFHWHIGGPLSGIYRSQDGGDSWTRLTAGLPTDDMGKIGLAIAPTNTDVVYANIINPTGTLQGIYRSTDGGDTWVKRNNKASEDWFGGFGYYFGQIRVDPGDADTVYALDIRLLRSTNGGKSVNPIATAVHWDWHDLIVEPSGRWLGATDGGFYISNDDGASWTHADSLAITQFYDLGIDALDPRRRFAGSQDNGTLRTVTGGLNDWAEVLSDDGLQCEVDYTDSMKVYASRQFGGFVRSTDGGDSFVPATDGIDPSERVNWNAPLVLDPAIPSTMYTGTIRVYRSTDSMISWSPVSPDLTGTPSAAEDHPLARHGPAHTQGQIRRTVSALAVSPLVRDILWAGTDDGNVWVSADGGAGWTRVNPPGLQYWVTDLAADPFASARAYVSVTGYRQGDELPYLRVTEDLGATWSDITGNLPAVPVNSVAADTTWRGRLFAGTDVGVYVSDDAGMTWSDMRSGLPYVVVLDLVRLESPATLYAATHGRSIYAFDLAQLGPADGDGDGVDNNADCALADPGAFAVPGEVDELHVGRGPNGESELSWTSLAASAGPGTLYDLARGVVADLALAGDTSGSASLACGVAGTARDDPAIPAAGAGFYYLVRGANACGLGSWGSSSGGAARTSGACP